MADLRCGRFQEMTRFIHPVGSAVEAFRRQ